MSILGGGLRAAVGAGEIADLALDVAEIAPVSAGNKAILGGFRREPLHEKPTSVRGGIAP
jgi:hypothetical protein